MGRAPCCDKNGLKKGPWTPEEDQKLIDYIQKHGYGNWRTLPKNAGLQRCGKSCRLRWTNYLRPDIKRGRFSFEEEETIIQLHRILGNKWSAIAARLPGRTDNEIKNYWNTHIRKRLLRMGIDPVTHSPRLDLLDLSSILSSSLYNHQSHHHVNMSRLLGGVQSFVNPELLRLATSLMSSTSSSSSLSQRQTQNETHQSFLLQNVEENQVQNQYEQLMQSDVHLPASPMQVHQEISNYIPFSSDDDAQLMSSNVDQFASNLTDFSEWQSGNAMAPSSLTEDYVPMQPNYNYYGSDQSVVDHPSSETSNNFHNSNNQSFSFASVLSTPSSSPTPLNSNSTYINGGSSTEDERESYCSNILKFEIPEILDVNDFI